MKHKRRIGADIIVPFILIAVVFGGLFWQKYREATLLPTLPPAQQGDAVIRKVVLFLPTRMDSLSGRRGKPSAVMMQLTVPAHCWRSFSADLWVILTTCCRNGLR